MYARILKFLTNLAFKRIFPGFLTGRKKRVPAQWRLCWICGYGFRAFNKRQKICVQKTCRKEDRARQYRFRTELANSNRRVAMAKLTTQEEEE